MNKAMTRSLGNIFITIIRITFYICCRKSQTTRSVYIKIIKRAYNPNILIKSLHVIRKQEILKWTKYEQHNLSKSRRPKF